MTAKQAAPRKKCTGCHKLKPLSKFYGGNKAYGRGGYMARCKVCTARKHTAQRRARLEAQPQLRQKWSEYRRNLKLQEVYGITAEQYNQMHTAQGGLCAICGKPEQRTVGPKRTPARLSVDHNHGTKQVRALLCAACNTALGSFNESPELLAKAIAYLTHWNRA